MRQEQTENKVQERKVTKPRVSIPNKTGQLPPR